MMEKARRRALAGRGRGNMEDPTARFVESYAFSARDFLTAFQDRRGCNLAVCLAVCLALAGRQVIDRIVAIIFPISAFVAAGFEHSIANMYFVPLAILLAGEGAPGTLTRGAFILHNLLPVTLGNVVGGAGMVGLVYHLIYERD
jgi:formate/nitrite transporter FocA (FNT family)